MGEAPPGHAIAEAERLGKRDDGLVVNASEAVFEVLDHRFSQQDAADQSLHPVLLTEGEWSEVGVFLCESLLDRVHDVADCGIGGAPAIDAELGRNPAYLWASLDSRVLKLPDDLRHVLGIEGGCQQGVDINIGDGMTESMGKHREASAKSSARPASARGGATPTAFDRGPDPRSECVAPRTVALNKAGPLRGAELEGRRVPRHEIGGAERSGDPPRAARFGAGP